MRISYSVAADAARQLRSTLACFLLAVPGFCAAAAPAGAGKVVVITGASSGFGKGVALKLAAAGDRVVLAARRTAVLQETAKACGNGALAVTTDVTRPADMERLARTALAHFGRIDVWINNAGVAALGRFDEVPLSDDERVVQTNLLGTMDGSRLALRQFRRQGAGTLINVSSIVGKIGLPYYDSYTATKFGIVGLDAALRQELRLEGMRQIHVCTVLPLAYDTPFFQHAANYTGHVPRMKPILDPAEVIEAIARLIDRPKAEVSPGIEGMVALLAAQFTPGLTAGAAARVQAQQMREAPAAPATTGALYHPVGSGTEVNGNMKERVAKERRAAQAAQR